MHLPRLLVTFFSCCHLTKLSSAYLLLPASAVWLLSLICALAALLTDLQTSHMGETGMLYFWPFPSYKVSTQRSDRGISYTGLTERGSLSSLWMGKGSWVIGQKQRHRECWPQEDTVGAGCQRTLCNSSKTTIMPPIDLLTLCRNSETFMLLNFCARFIPVL